MTEMIDAELHACGGVRVTPPDPEELAAVENKPAALDPNQDFMRMLRLSGLGSEEMTDDQRDAFINMAENLGIDAGEAEDMVDRYLEEIGAETTPSPPKPVTIVTPKAAAATGYATLAAPVVIDAAAERLKYPNFVSSIGAEMFLVPSGSFKMGSEAPDAAPNERPLTQITLTGFYLSRHPITNAQ
jgi:formylglycine-generating enzyme required for sulfatase activity